MQRLSIPIAGMSCGGCVRAVRDALAKVPGVNIEQVTVGKDECNRPDTTLEGLKKLPGAFNRKRVREIFCDGAWIVGERDLSRAQNNDQG